MGNLTLGFICPNLFGRFAVFSESTFFKCFLYFIQEWISSLSCSMTKNMNVIKSHQKFVFQHIVIFRFWIFLIYIFYTCVYIYKRKFCRKSSLNSCWRKVCVLCLDFCLNRRIERDRFQNPMITRLLFSVSFGLQFKITP